MTADPELPARLFSFLLVGTLHVSIATLALQILLHSSFLFSQHCWHFLLLKTVASRSVEAEAIPVSVFSSLVTTSHSHGCHMPSVQAACHMLKRDILDHFSHDMHQYSGPEGLSFPRKRASNESSSDDDSEISDSADSDE